MTAPEAPMPDAPKPLTMEEWEATKLETYPPYGTRGRVNATLDALYAENAALRKYRKRTRGMYSSVSDRNADRIAAELGIE